MYIRTTGWRKISFYFNLSFEIKDKTIEFDENRNVQRAEFIVRAYMQYVPLTVWIFDFSLFKIPSLFISLLLFLFLLPEVEDFQTDGVHVNDGRRSSQNQIMIFLAQQKLEPKIGHARCVI